VTQGGYKQFCPVAMASEVLCTRWTMLLLREMVAGSTRFNDLRRGVPRMSPALLSKRLKDLEDAGIVGRAALRSDPAIFEYRLTNAGRELKAVIDSIGVWGQHWVEAQLSLANLDPSLLMWDMRRNLDPSPMPDRRCVIHFAYPDQPNVRRRWWLVVEPDREVDLCSVDPGFEVDLYVAVDLRTMTAIWMGLVNVRDSVAGGKMILTGDRNLASQMQLWLGLSPFAKEKKLATA
jgi:DNA-binding HxlR family transcriptional regulator